MARKLGGKYFFNKKRKLFIRFAVHHTILNQNEPNYVKK